MHRPARCCGVLVALVVLVGSAATARRREVGRGEERVFRVLNGAPDRLHGPVWVVMQSGSLGAVFVTSGLLRRAGRGQTAATALAAGTLVWAGVKAVKPLVGRGRPARHLEGVAVRGQQQTGLGYPSGHTAVADDAGHRLGVPSPDRGAGRRSRGGREHRRSPHLRRRPPPARRDRWGRHRRSHRSGCDRRARTVEAPMTISSTIGSASPLHSGARAPEVGSGARGSRHRDTRSRVGPRGSRVTVWTSPWGDSRIGSRIASDSVDADRRRGPERRSPERSGSRVIDR